MQEFSTTDTRHSFKIDDVEYHLPGLTVDDFEAVTAVYAKSEAEMVPAFRDFILDRAPKNAQQVLRKLTIRQTGQLFTEWVGLKGVSADDLGKSSSSSV